MALGIFDMRWPPYAADITLELHQHRQTNESFVKVSYIGQVGMILCLCQYKLVRFFFPRVLRKLLVLL